MWRPGLLARPEGHAWIEPPGRLDVALRLGAADLGSEKPKQRELLHHAEVVPRTVRADGGRGRRAADRWCLLPFVGEPGQRFPASCRVHDVAVSLLLAIEHVE